jgi:hypothetical protein
MELPVTSRRPPLPPLVCMRFPEYASFSVLRETPVPFSRHHFKKLKCYEKCKTPVWIGTADRLWGDKTFGGFAGTAWKRLTPNERFAYDCCKRKGPYGLVIMGVCS